MNKYYFFRLFHHAAVAAFLEYLKNVRLAKARQMLTDTALSLSGTAAWTGFASSVDLSGVLHAFCRQPPKEFRKKNGKVYGAGSSI